MTAALARVDKIQKADVSDRSKTAARVSAGTLLLLEARTRRQATDAIDAAIDKAVADAARQRRAGRNERAALLALILLASRDMATLLGSALFRGRLGAREGAVGRLRVELGAAGVILAAHALRPASHRLVEDTHHAGSAAESLAIAWRGVAIHRTLQAARQGDDVVSAIESTRGPMGPRLVRTAATETSQSYNDEHTEALADAMVYQDGLAEALEAAQVVRVWDAILDLRTCAECGAHDGEIAPPGQSFRSGHEPGFVHPLCRCISTVLALPMSASLLKAA